MNFPNYAVFLFAGLSAAAGAGETPLADAYRDFRDATVLHEDENSPFLQSIAITGLYDGRWYDAESDQGEAAGWDHRRTWIGVKLRALESVTFRGRVNVNTTPGFPGALVESVEDLELIWSYSEDDKLAIGLFKPRLIEEYIQPPFRLHTWERSQIINQIAPGKTGGLEFRGDQGPFSYRAGVFTGALSEDWDLPEFSGGYGFLGSIGRDLTDTTELRFDYFYSDGDSGSNGFKPYEHIFSLNAISKWEHGGMIAEAIGATGHGATGDVAGLVLMPWVDLSDRWQAVFRYQLSGSGASDGLRLQRFYERAVAPAGADRGDLYQAAYLGLNYLIDGNNLKLQTGIEYSRLEGANDLDPWTFFAGVRAYF